MAQSQKPDSGDRAGRTRAFVAAFAAILVLVSGVSLYTNLSRRTDDGAAALARSAVPAAPKAALPAPALIPAAPASAVAAARVPTAPLSPVPQGFEPLEIVTAGGVRAFHVEVMRNDEQRARGLMFRQSLDADKGMLFDFDRETPASMWMKNTLISLDMVFITGDGRIHRIEERTEPMSERTIPSGAPVRAVLELAGGTAARLGIKRGDKVSHAMFR